MRGLNHLKQDENVGWRTATTTRTTSKFLKVFGVRYKQHKTHTSAIVICYRGDPEEEATFFSWKSMHSQREVLIESRSSWTMRMVYESEVTFMKHRIKQEYLEAGWDRFSQRLRLESLARFAAFPTRKMRNLRYIDWETLRHVSKKKRELSLDLFLFQFNCSDDGWEGESGIFLWQLVLVTTSTITKIEQWLNNKACRFLFFKGLEKENSTAWIFAERPPSSPRSKYYSNMHESLIDYSRSYNGKKDFLKNVKDFSILLARAQKHNKQRTDEIASRFSVVPLYFITCERISLVQSDDDRKAASVPRVAGFPPRFAEKIENPLLPVSSW